MSEGAIEAWTGFDNEAGDGTVGVGDGIDGKAGGGTSGGVPEKVGGTDSETGEEAGSEVGGKDGVKLLERALRCGAKSPRISANAKTELMTLPWSLPLT